MRINIDTEHDENVVIMAEREWESMKVLITKEAPELVEKLKALNITVTVVGYPDDLGVETIESYKPVEGEVTRDLGEVTVTPDGLGIYGATVKPVKLRLLAITDTDVERDAEGRLTFVGCAELRAYFTRDEWSPKDGLLYTDEAVSEQVRAYLSEKLGIPDVCDWSEAGMQGRDYAHFDLSYDALETIFPDVPALKLVDPENANVRPSYLGPPPGEM